MTGECHYADTTRRRVVNRSLSPRPHEKPHDDTLGEVLALARSLMASFGGPPVQRAGVARSKPNVRACSRVRMRPPVTDLPIVDCDAAPA
jgi:hypothetical protein